MSTKVTRRTSKGPPRAAAKPPKSAKKEEKEEEEADGPRKGRARSRRKATASVALSEPQAKRRLRAATRRGRGEAGSPHGFQTHRQGLWEHFLVPGEPQGCQEAGQELCGAEPGTL